MAERMRAMEQIAELIPQAQDAGISVAEIARLTGITRTAVYDQLNAGRNGH
jgi:hypothetical protein